MRKSSQLPLNDRLMDPMDSDADTSCSCAFKPLFVKPTPTCPDVCVTAILMLRNTGTNRVQRGEFPHTYLAMQQAYGLLLSAGYVDTKSHLPFSLNTLLQPWGLYQ